MPRKVKVRPGPLSMEDKVYIAERFATKSPEWISEKLGKSLTTVSNYIDKISNKEAIEKAALEEAQRVSEEQKRKMKVDLSEKTGVATVMTEAGAGMPIKLNRRKSEFIKKK